MQTLKDTLFLIFGFIFVMAPMAFIMALAFWLYKVLFAGHDTAPNLWLMGITFGSFLLSCLILRLTNSDACRYAYERLKGNADV